MAHSGKIAGLTGGNREIVAQERCEACDAGRQRIAAWTEAGDRSASAMRLIIH